MTERTDREMLELAAKAAGIGPILCYESKRNCLRIGDRNSYRLWRPLHEARDTLALAVALNMSIEIDAFNRDTLCMTTPKPLSNRCLGVTEDHGKDAYTATLRAIVRAAAAMAEGGEQ